ncbi:four helix bundle protein [Mongoliitalea daihaiensis]|uniref:four helix bundle protein n=1 Tax=Mongoliitalea daihaiensis TaxID=2782006 RepID=UPI001F4239B4|nr:four helix bundle protein [Mongoliitalea daihaiensis]UJP64187.1 four helix bundle protein [Mongoliitalea daihaiensis]
MKETIQEKTYRFAEVIIDAYLYLYDKGHFRLANQLVGAGTSIGANVEEAQAAQSKADFISKMSIAHKEARECKYWLKLLNKPKLLKEFDEFSYLLNEIQEINKVLYTIIKSSKSNLQNSKRKGSG